MRPTWSLVAAGLRPTFLTIVKQFKHLGSYLSHDLAEIKEVTWRSSTAMLPYCSLAGRVLATPAVDEPLRRSLADSLVLTRLFYQAHLLHDIGGNAGKNSTAHT